MKFTKSQLLKALKETKGVFSDTAKSLGVTRQAVSKRVHADAKLLEIARAFKDELVDAAERTLRKKVEAGNLKAAIFTLTTIGRDRGYSRTLAVEEKGGAGVVYIVPQGMTIEEAQAQQGKVEGVSVWLPDNQRCAQGGTEGKDPKEPKVECWFPDDGREGMTC